MSEPKPEQAVDEAANEAANEAAMDPIDLLVRRSMRELDGATPAAYFEALPQRVDASIDAGFVGMDDDGDEVNERARRTSSQGLDFGPRERRPRRSSPGELRKSPATNPPLEAGADSKISVEPARSRRATDSRAYRRSLLQTHVGAPQPWWQTRAVALAVAGVAIAAAIVVAVVKWTDESASSSDQLGASSSRIHEPPRPGVRVTAPVDAAPPLTAEQLQLRRQLAAVLPVARACVGSRPIDEVQLAVTIDDTSAVRAVSVRGDAGSPEAESCVIEAVRATAEALTVPGGARTIAIPLFD